ncbi:MAG TPA: sigma-70 family RNA polymerase sigma factor [Candidatus Angelobacter sp.]
MDPKDLSTQELLRLCLGTQDPALWQEFVRRTRPCIAGTVLKTIRRWAAPQPSFVDDLVQEIYVKLFDKNYKALRAFHWNHENALFGFLKTVASRVVYDYFRKFRPEEVDPEPVIPILPAPIPHPDQQLRFDEILRCLYQLKDEPNCERDRDIFLLYYAHGFTADEISRLAGIGLSVKGVESTLLRMVRRIRECLGRAPK